MISGYYGYGNAGDEAILHSLVTSLRSLIPDLAIVVLSGSPSRTARNFPVKAIRRDNLPLIAWHLLSTDLFISGGGGLVQDTTGVTTIRYYLGLVYLAQKLRRKTMLYAQGIGPIATAEGKSFTAKVAGKVSLITVRDEESRELLTSLGVTGVPLYVTADAVLAMKPAPRDDVVKILEREGIPRDGLRIGLSLRSWKSSADFTGIMRDVASHLIRRHSAHIVLFPFQRSQDYPICSSVKGQLGEFSHLLEGEYPPDVLMGLMGEMDALVGMRLHSLIFSAVQGVPMLGLEYDPKVRNFLAQVGAPWVPLEEMRSDTILARLEDLLANRVDTRRALLQRVAPLSERARENARLAVALIESRGEPAKTEKGA